MDSRRANRRLVAALVLGAVAIGLFGSSSTGAGRTAVVRYSPFDASSQIKPALRVHTLRAGSCVGVGSEAVGDVAYRCGSGRFIVDPCWRDGPGATEFVVCAIDPWVKTVQRFRVPHLLLDAGVTFGRSGGYPWGIELRGGDRCELLQGAHEQLPKSQGGLTVEYQCRSDLLLLRNLRRGRVWRIGAARFHNGHFKRRGSVAIRRATFGGLPPAMQQQNDLARQALAPARRLVRRRHSRPPSRDGLRFVEWVRMVLPTGDWVRVRFLNGWTAVLHRENGAWVEAPAFKPYCQRLPADVRSQLFTTAECS